MSGDAQLGADTGDPDSDPTPPEVSGPRAAESTLTGTHCFLSFGGRVPRGRVYYYFLLFDCSLLSLLFISEAHVCLNL